MGSQVSFALWHYSKYSARARSNSHKNGTFVILDHLDSCLNAAEIKSRPVTEDVFEASCKTGGWNLSRDELASNGKDWINGSIPDSGRAYQLGILLEL